MIGVRYNNLPLSTIKNNNESDNSENKNSPQHHKKLALKHLTDNLPATDHKHFMEIMEEYKMMLSDAKKEILRQKVKQLRKKAIAEKWDLKKWKEERLKVEKKDEKYKQFVKDLYPNSQELIDAIKGKISNKENFKQIGLDENKKSTW
jgi:hypothetical protein